MYRYVYDDWFSTKQCIIKGFSIEKIEERKKKHHRSIIDCKIDKRSGKENFSSYI